MKKSFIYSCIAAVSITLVCVAVVIFSQNKKDNDVVDKSENASSVLTSSSKSENSSTLESTSKETDNNSESSSNGAAPYISITYGVPNRNNTTGRDMEFYTYDLVEKKLKKQCNIPFDAQYGVGVVNLFNDTVYYSKRSDSDNPSSNDNICSYNIKTKESKLVETDNRTFNDITLINPNTLLVTAVINKGAIIPALYNLDSNQYTYDYEANNEERGLYTSRPAPINYNYKFKKFVSVYSAHEDAISQEFRSEGKPVDYHISLIDESLKRNPDYEYSLPLTIDKDITMVTQITNNTVLVLISDLYAEKDNYYLLKFGEGEPTFTEIDSPFPEITFLRNCITLDDGKSYYISGSYKTGENKYETGLFHYDCETKKFNNILLNDLTDDKHIINFFVMGF